MKRMILAAVVWAVLPLSALAQEPIKIGFISTFSGPSGNLGQELFDGFKLGLKSVGNKAGGRPIDVIQADDQAKPDVGRQLADKMVERDRVHIITGVNFSNVMLALAKPVLDAGAFLSSTMPARHNSGRAVPSALFHYLASERHHSPRRWAYICRTRRSSACT